MLDDGIATRRGIMCAHREVPYQRADGYNLPESERAQDRRIVLPMYPQMTNEDQDYVIEMLREACAS
jgi:dTDP-4-amino-4,6-dideoxygalactose transaminase